MMQADNPGREQKNTRNLEVLAWIWHTVTSSVCYQPKKIHKVSPVSKGLELDSTSLQVELQSHTKKARDTELGSCVHTVYKVYPLVKMIHFSSMCKVDASPLKTPQMSYLIMASCSKSRIL